MKNTWEPLYTYSGFKSSKSMDFVFKFPPCSYSRIIPEKKNYWYCKQLKQ